MRRIVRFGAALAALGLVAATSPLAQAGGVKVGVLKCKITSGWGLVLVSNKGVDCVFEPTNYRWRDHYVGTINKFGADIGVTNGGYLLWAVFAPGSVSRGSLSGRYYGASAEATVGIGVGANVLIGGFEDSFNLQPISLQGQTGLNVAGGVAGLFLESH